MAVATLLPSPPTFFASFSLMIRSDFFRILGGLTCLTRALTFTPSSRPLTPTIRSSSLGLSKASVASTITSSSPTHVATFTDSCVGIIFCFFVPFCLDVPTPLLQVALLCPFSLHMLQ